MYRDYEYLLMALRSNGTSVECPEARASLEKLGYMTPATIRYTFGGGIIPHGMVLTKAGQKRAQEIFDARERANRERRHPKDRRGYRGAAFPRRWKVLK